jgi:hypothetical protein
MKIINEEIIKNIILKELEQKPGINNWHNITYGNIDNYLITPVKRKLVEPITNTIKEYWIVLDEDATSGSNGYLIIFSEDEQSFGIATKQNIQFPNVGTCVSLYETFIDALNAM